jgi:hypothetical protein
MTTLGRANECDVRQPAVALLLAGGVAILAFYFTVVSSWMVSLLAK